MDEKLKQRLVGAMVLMALAVIFLPSLFQQDERQKIDTTSQIPPAPVFEPVIIPKPVKPEGIKQPDLEKLFQPQTAPNLQNALKCVWTCHAVFYTYCMFIS